MGRRAHQNVCPYLSLPRSGDSRGLTRLLHPTPILFGHGSASGGGGSGEGRRCSSLARMGHGHRHHRLRGYLSVSFSVAGVVDVSEG